MKSQTLGRRNAAPVQGTTARPSAGSGDLFSIPRFLRGIGLLDEIALLTAVVLTDARLDLLRVQRAVRLGDGLLAVQPLRLDGVQPRRLARQGADHDAHPALLLDPPVVFLDPRPHALADVPGRVAPHPQPRLLP